MVNYTVSSFLRAVRRPEDHNRGRHAEMLCRFGTDAEEIHQYGTGEEQ